jgi:hypothetical protein
MTSTSDRSFALVERALVFGAVFAAALAIASFFLHAKSPAYDAATAGRDAISILP